MNSEKSKKEISGVSAKYKRSISDIELYETIGEVVLSEDSDSDSSPEDTSSKDTVKPEITEPEVKDGKESEDVEDKDISGMQDECTKPQELFDFTQILQTQEEVARLTEKISKETTKKCDAKKTSKTRHTKCDSKDNIDSLDISHLLSIGEKRTQTDLGEEEKSSSDDEDSDVNEEIPTLQSVQITIQEPDICSRRKKCKDPITAELSKLIHLKRKRHQLLLHKSCLVCIISSGMFMNTVVNSEELMGLALSIIPSQKYYPPEKVTKGYMEQLLKWFHNKIKITERPMDKNKSLLNELIETFGTCSPRSPNIFVLMFVAVARFVGLKCRLVINLRPVSLKPPAQILPQKKKSERDRTSESESPPEKKPCSSNAKGKTVKTKPSTSAIKKANTRSKTASTSKNASTEKLENMSSAKSKRKVISSDDGEDEVFDKKSLKPIVKKKAKSTTDMWVEVYVEKEKKWLPYDVVNNRSDCVKLIYQNCHAPVCYILAWNNDGTIKDVTRRYVPQWHICLKSRVDCQWWQLTLKPWTPLKTKIDLEEDDELERIVTETPLPTTISEYKNHPHYALKRHLLKFEAIYPPTAVPLGRVHDEDVYARVCVVELHTKESWIKEGKVLQAGQEPYKIVKARPKREKGSGKLIKDIPLNLYGKWQVEDYVPPTAVDGKVPRNDFGNVELYKPNMVPKGTVHLQLPSLMRIARKMKIDCAPAVVGWEFRGHGSHPVLDGVVVCEEFKQKLLDAWSREMDNVAETNRDSTKLRALNNWRKLVRPLLLRDKLSGKYNFKFSSVGANRKKK